MVTAAALPPNPRREEANPRLWSRSLYLPPDARPLAVALLAAQAPNPRAAQAAANTGLQAHEGAQANEGSLGGRGSRVQVKVWSFWGEDLEAWLDAGGCRDPQSGVLCMPVSDLKDRCVPRKPQRAKHTMHLERGRAGRGGRRLVSQKGGDALTRAPHPFPFLVLWGSLPDYRR